MRRRQKVSVVRWLLQRIVVAVGALAFTALFFLLLPVIQAISASAKTDVVVRSVSTAPPPPPPPPPEPEPPKEQEKEKEPPKLEEEAPPLDLSQLELALDPGGGVGGWSAGDLGAKLEAIHAGGSGDDSLSLDELDQRPRVIYQPSPVVDSQLRKKTPAKIYVVFIVDQRGRVQNPIVQSASDPAFAAPALSAVKKWKFEPGKRSGKAVRFRMRVPITFPEQG